MSAAWTGRHWGLVDHACRLCLGRVMVDLHETPKGWREGGTYSCSACGTVAIGTPKGICGCGLKTDGQKTERFRCIRNPAPSPSNLSQIVIVAGQVELQAGEGASALASEQDTGKRARES